MERMVNIRMIAIVSSAAIVIRRSVIGINIISSHNRIVDIVAVVYINVHITGIDLISTSAYTFVIAIPGIFIIPVVNIAAVIILVDICSVIVTPVIQIPVIVTRIIANVPVRGFHTSSIDRPFVASAAAK